MTISRKLNLGCGTDIREGFHNVDVVLLPGVDEQLDLKSYKLPYEENFFEVIVCRDVLEHLEHYPLMLQEIHRVLQPGGRVEIQVPHFTSWYAFGDPQHVKFFSVRTFDFFIENSRRSYYYPFKFRFIRSRKLQFSNRIIRAWVNRSFQSQEVYESSLLRLFPAGNIEIVLEK